MPSALSVTIEGLEGFQRAVRKSPDISLKHLQVAIKKSLLEIQREAVPRTPISEGRLRGSYRASLSKLQGTLSVDADYAVYVHEGTRPHWPPYQQGTPLSRWANLHGIEPFLVARAISRRGTKPKPFLKEGVEAAQENIKKYFAEELESTLDDIERESK